MARKITRRRLLQWMLVSSGLVLWSAACSGNVPAPISATRRPVPAPAPGQAYLAVAHGEDAAMATRAAIAAIGGMGRFVKTGDDVIVKPNICTDYHPPEYATTTNPIVVGTLVALCLEAGARRVRVMDMPFGGTPETAYAVSGIADATHAARGEMEVMSPLKFIMTNIPQGRDITQWEVYRDVLEADVFINVPIAKHHSLARLSLACKNLLGVVRQPNRMHRNLGQRLADLASLIKPSLTVVDAMRILVANGPTGGSLNDVRQTNMVIASHDMVAADAFAATLFGLRGEDIPYIKLSSEMGLGTLDLNAIRIEEINA
jgi:uncharacterized protein (DUF362 family)